MTNRKPKRNGLVQVYTGDGKGKTTAALGLALRMAGQGGRVIVIQFLKGGRPGGEHKFIGKYRPFKIVKLNKGNALKQSLEELYPVTERTFALALETVIQGDYDLVILDEILAAVAKGLLKPARVLDLIARKPPEVELVLTGRGAPPEVIERADLATEMKAVKHPMEKGIKARRGIEY
ncbi:MAG: cob(I)yrinic acid a,c-diamide adenosyltransferase [Chloroflexota bacterium]